MLINYGMPFDQEKPLEGFFFDFGIPSLRLLIEVDSRYHDHERKQRIDRIKDAVAKRNGWKLVRVRGGDIAGKVQAALDIRFSELGREPCEGGHRVRLVDP